MSDAVPVGVAARPRARVAGVVAALFVVAAGAGAGALAVGVDTGAAGAWLLGTLVVLGWEWQFLVRRVGLNHPPGARESPSGVDDGVGAGIGAGGGIGVANAVTLGRGALFAAVAGLLLTGPLPGPWRWAPALLYGAGAGLDAADGAVARELGRRTVLGARLDLAFDTLGFLVAPLVGVAWGRLPAFYLAISAARYLFKLGLWSRRRRGLPVFDLPASRLRRPLAGLQMGFIAVALAPVVPVGTVAAAAAVVVTPSLAVFGRDYLAVTGRVGGGATATAVGGETVGGGETIDGGEAVDGGNAPVGPDDGPPDAPPRGDRDPLPVD